MCIPARNFLSSPEKKLDNPRVLCYALIIGEPNGAGRQVPVDRSEGAEMTKHGTHVSRLRASFQAQATAVARGDCGQKHFPKSPALVELSAHKAAQAQGESPTAAGEG